MKTIKALFLVLSIILGSAGMTAAQLVIRIQPGAEEHTDSRNEERDYEDLIRDVFAPITDELNLSSEQKFKIAAIITSAVIEADPLMDQLDELDDQLSAAVLFSSFSEAKIKDLSAREARLLEQVIAMKARAKASMFRVLTPEQRALVEKQFTKKPGVEGTVGSISNQ